MDLDFRKRWFIPFTVLLIIWTSFSIAVAQSPVLVRISRPIIEQFPQITLFVAVIDSTGRYIPGLPPSTFSILEDETPITDVTVLEEQVGTRQIYVINTSPDLKIRDALGRTRFDLVRQSLLTWWQLPDASLIEIDDLSLITAEGIIVAHKKSTADLGSALNQLTPSFEDTISGYDLLLQALDSASDPTPMPGMPTHLTFFTSLLRIPRDLPISNIIARSRETGTTIHPVLIGPPETIEQPEAEPLYQIAEATGGQLILFDPLEGLTDLAERILAQRTQYQLTYTSRAITSGPHQIQVRVNQDDQEVLSEVQVYETDVQPPEVTFITPPDSILRYTDDPSMALSHLPPTSQQIRVLITFPDQHPRGITSSQLLVDGEVATQQITPPYEVFEWDLSSYTESGAHVLQVVVEDALGLQGSSVTHSVDLIVETPPRGLAALKPAMGSLLAALAVLIAGVILAIGLFTMGRQRLAPGSTSAQTSAKRKSPLKRAGFRQRSTSQIAEAFLLLLDDQGREGKTIPLTGADFILGSDPSLTPIPLEDPSVAGIHARLTRQADGDYLIRDQGSVAGTWVNYAPLLDEGQILRHGDLIHVGRVALRFRLPSPPPPPEVRISPSENSQAGTAPSQEKPL